jgi:hypothetical protein
MTVLFLRCSVRDKTRPVRQFYLQPWIRPGGLWPGWLTADPFGQQRSGAEYDQLPKEQEFSVSGLRCNDLSKPDALPLAAGLWNLGRQGSLSPRYASAGNCRFLASR